MAASGYKLFVTGDVLTAAQVNDYLMLQTVMVFANSAARTTALSGVLAEGLVSYLKDTDVVEVYTGAAWVSLDDPNAIQNSIVDAKGDLISATADNTPARLAVGTNGQTLVADSTASTGLKWATPSSTFAGCRVTNTTNISIANSTDTALTFNTETYDTDAFHDTSTNTSRLTIPTGKAGYYQINANILWAGNGTGIRDFNIYKNGVRANYLSMSGQATNSQGFAMSTILYGAVGDYFEIYVFQNSGGALNIQTNAVGAGATSFSCGYLGA